MDSPRSVGKPTLAPPGDADADAPPPITTASPEIAMTTSEVGARGAFSHRHSAPPGPDDRVGASDGPDPLATEPNRSDGRPRSPRLLVTAGPSHEPIDEVRVLANRSSGRLGLAVARAAERRGWPVTCLLGPVPPPEDPPVRVLRFRTAAELETLLRRCWPDHDLLIMAAAVADFRPRRPHAGKLPRGAPLTLDLEPVPDLLAGLAATTAPAQRRIGFALEEPRHLEARAAEKLRRKDLDAIVANPIETLDSPGIRGVLLRRDGDLRTPPEAPDPISKERFAEWLLDEALLLWERPGPATAPPLRPH